ncbi:MAG: DNA mismatch repair endonuclease MutL [Methanophagales archaeon]|nr:DNA mismatch repair endonuclease MutL [Methanophagales archaeon]MCW3138974.1 DNA mismatch repair endonuclease MutL [Methanophagales archaeon]MCW3139936.1 DNA mismatch repair endonuclease MutL [Methanophagales archaeon]MCW7069648.1 DNA mismatch repair endonuclease MutL [Methanophagales archaeon]MCW7072918.1 DNA mismatch repair endonuclease MutL [Methanophagales archaeon]
MRHIFVLEEHTIGKIAAGEVVDRPASVVKELIENSLDAGCRHVIVELGNSGRDYIRVTDDGCGISGEDVEVAFQKHATSKIKKIEDLLTLKTLGFRGEALPSIAAVSRMAVSTRHEDEDFGTYLSIDGGKIKERRRISRSIGTTIEVKSLFYNLPARIGMIKSRSTELRHIMDVFMIYALIYPEIKFELFHDGRLILSTSGNGKMLDTIVKTFGHAVAKELIELKESKSNAETGLKLYGFISKPAVSYSTRRYIFTYVNRRYVKNELMLNAIKRGYKTLLPKNIYPFAVLSLQIEPSEINVNIHPKKHEITFFHPENVFQFIVSSISTTLRHADLIPEVVQRAEKERGASRNELFGLPEEKADKKRETVSVHVQTSFQSSVVEAEANPEMSSLDILPAPLYQVLDSYIIAESKSGDVIMIDQHAAAERINFEKLIARYGRRIEKQALLRPYVPELSPNQLLLLRESEQVLRDMGFDIEPLSDGSYIIRAIPVVFHGMVHEDELMEIIQRLIGDRSRVEERIKLVFATAACKASIKAGEKLSYESMRAIVEELKKTKIPYTCPHGRPTMIRLSRKDIEKRFKRR